MVILKEMNYIVLRSRGRTALSVCIAALLVCCMSFYLGSIQTAESAEENLAQVIPVTAQVVSRSGARTVGFEIDENHFANLMKADIKDAVYTACFWRSFMRAKSFSSTARRSARISDLSIGSNDLRSVGSVFSHFSVSILLYLAKKFNRT